MPREERKDICKLSGIVTLICLLSFPLCAQVPATDNVQLRIEAVGANNAYKLDSGIPIRCRFKNAGDTPVSLVLPGLGSRHNGLTSLGLEVTVKRENEKTPLYRGRSDFRSEFCRGLSGKLDSEVKCNSPVDMIDLQPRKEFVRTVHLKTLLSGLGTSGWKMQPGKYLVQITSSQAEGKLVSNELAIEVKP